MTKALEILRRIEEYLFLFGPINLLSNLLNFFSLEPLWIEPYLRQSTIIYLPVIHTQVCQRDLQCWTWSTLWAPKLPCRACQKGQISQWLLKARLPSCRKCLKQLCISCCQVLAVLDFPFSHEQHRPASLIQQPDSSLRVTVPLRKQSSWKKQLDFSPIKLLLWRENQSFSLPPPQQLFFLAGFERNEERTCAHCSSFWWLHHWCLEQLFEWPQEQGWFPWLS